MVGFDKVRFNGSFRVYQQRVLDNIEKYLDNGKINIVAAPGSGKTVLGLELICRLASPCIILSPTTAIRQQWGERLKELFLEDEKLFDQVFSNDLHTIKLFNSITYQALYTSIEKVSETAEDDFDCSDVDLFRTMREYGIKTVCLDEAHHLKNEWQKALEKFLATLDRDVSIIALTATPPYDSSDSEWNRYISVCGEIDEEIFVPELVGQKNLCPHQDYIYFNYPNEDEIEGLKTHKDRAANALDKIGSLAFINTLVNRLNNERDYEILFASVNEYTALLVLLNHYGFEIKPRLIRQLTAKRKLPAFRMHYAEMAIQFLLDSDLLSDSEKEEIIHILKDNSVYEKRRVALVLNDRLKRSLISSVGKLESIKQITKSEYANMGDRLRMLILTDYIRKEKVKKIATDEAFNSVNVVSIFELLRRENIGAKMGVLSGSLIILPDSIDLSPMKHKKEPIEGTDYCTVSFSGSIHKAIKFIGNLFEQGQIQVLIGTKSLLGEGWDSPCINSLIMASFVGSFVLSNQMRGRAIRVDKRDPNKTANIWHLVSVEPEYLFDKYSTKDKNILTSYDFDTLKRRFESFMGPNYSTGRIESGIERITAIAPPFDKEGIDRINRIMQDLSSKREDIADKWKDEVVHSKFSVAVKTEVPKQKRVPVFSFSNLLLCLLLVAIPVLLWLVVLPFVKTHKGMKLLITIALLILAAVLYRPVKRLLLHLSPAQSVRTLGKALYRTLRDCGLISPDAKVESVYDRKRATVKVSLKEASARDQNTFNAAMQELLSPIDNPRFILIAKSRNGRYKYRYSFACPSIIGKKKEFVEILAWRLKSTTGNFEPVFVHRADGRKIILRCRKRSYISRSQKVRGKRLELAHAR